MGFVSNLFSSSPDPASSDAYAPALLDQLSLGVSIYRLEDLDDPDSFRLVYSNAASGELTGLDVDAEVGRRLVEVAPGVRGLGLLDRYAQVVRTGEGADLGRIDYPGGRIPAAAFHVRAVPLPDQAVGVVFEDIGHRDEVRALEAAQTDLQRQAADLHQQEARYRSLVEATAAIVWTTPPSGAFESDQPSWRAFTGQTQDELAGSGWLEAVHPDDRDDTLAAWQRAVAERAPYVVRHRLRHAAGGYRTMQVRAVPVSRDGEVDEWVGVHSDVEEQEAAAAALAASEARLRTLVDAVSDVLLVYPISADGRAALRTVNRAAIETYGYTEAELLAMSVAELVDPTSADIEASLAELRRTRSATFESVHVAKDGRRIPMRTNARLAELDGELCVVALARDDTETRQVRRQLGRANLGLEREVEKRTAQLEAFAEDLKILHGITTQTHATPADRYAAYLEAGCQMFGLPIGILSATPEDPETGERLYRLEAVVAPDPEIQAGLTIPLSEAFCDAVVASGETVVYGDAAQEAPGHPACVGRGLRAFIGTPVRVDGELVGTLNFVSPEPRPEGFAPYERELVEVMADAVGRRLAGDRAGEAEAEAREWYRSIVETVDEGVIVVDPTCAVILSNPSARTFLGLADEDQADGTDALAERWPVVDADGRALLAEALPEREVLRTGAPVRGAVQGILRPDGTTRWYRVNATPIDRDRDGQPEYVVVSFADVTELQGATVAASRTRALLSSVLDASPDGVMAFRAVRDGDAPDAPIVDFEWLLVNPRAGDIVGRAPETLLGERLLDVFPGNREAGLYDAYVEVVEAGERFETLVSYAADGLDTSFRITATPIPAQDGFTVTFAEVYDAGALAAERDA